MSELEEIAAASRVNKSLLTQICPLCSRSMRLNRIAPDNKNDHVDSRIYECECGHELEQTVAL